MSGHRNPYVAGPQVGGTDAFVGRDDILDRVALVLEQPDPGGVILHGQRRIGKTSILHHLITYLPKRGPFRVVYFDLQDKATSPTAEILLELASTIATEIKLSAPSPPSADIEQWWRDQWLPEALSTLPSNGVLTILFDEFDVLANRPGDRFFEYLRKLVEQRLPALRLGFVVGRDIQDLAIVAGGLFKTLQTIPVSLLSEKDAHALMRMSHANGSMTWSDAALQVAWSLTNGHPFLLQQLCWNIWSYVNGERPPGTPAQKQDVTTVVSSTLDASRAALEWIWDGLSPSLRTVAAALAGLGSHPITEEALEDSLQRAGARDMIPDLASAPQSLIEWGLLEKQSNGYRFRVELIRQWIAKYKLLGRVKDELGPAHGFYTTAVLRHRLGRDDEAINDLRDALNHDPGHVNASLLLADILKTRGQWTEAEDLLTRLYRYDPRAANSGLVQLLVELANSTSENNQDEQLKLYDRILSIQDHPTVRLQRQQIWKARAELALREERYDDAIAAYKTADCPEEVNAVQEKVRQRELQVEAASREEMARRTAAKYIKKQYLAAQQAVEKKQANIAIPLLQELISADPTYGDVALLLHQATTGTNLLAELAEEKREHEQTKCQNACALKAEAILREQTRDQLYNHQRWQAPMRGVMLTAGIIVGAMLVGAWSFGRPYLVPEVDAGGESPTSQPSSPPTIPTCEVPSEHFNDHIARCIMGEAAAKAAAQCKGDVPAGDYTVTIIFAQSGKVRSARVYPPSDARKGDQCITSRFDSISVPPFVGSPDRTISWTVNIKK